MWSTTTVSWLISNLDGWGCRRLGGEGDRDQPRVLAMGAGDLDQRLVFLLGHHLQLAIGQGFPTLGALKPTRLPPEDIDHVHGSYLPAIPNRQTSKPDNA